MGKKNTNGITPFSLSIKTEEMHYRYKLQNYVETRKEFNSVCGNSNAVIRSQITEFQTTDKYYLFCNNGCDMKNFTGVQYQIKLKFVQSAAIQQIN